MESNIKKLLNELASFLKTQKLQESDIHINELYEKMGREFLFFRGGNIFYWLDKKVTPENDEEFEQFNLVEDFMSQEDIDSLFSDFEALFKYCKVLNEFLVLEKTKVRFKSSITAKQHDEIREYPQIIWPWSDRTRNI